MFALSKSSITEKVEEYVKSKLNRTPESYAYTAYDAL